MKITFYKNPEFKSQFTSKETELFTKEFFVGLSFTLETATKEQAKSIRKSFYESNGCNYIGDYAIRNVSHNDGGSLFLAFNIETEAMFFFKIDPR